eukprot:Skav233178  [mRNA]  locus=scaffold24:132214:144521:+ [translate_table: standard]
MIRGQSGWHGDFDSYHLPSANCQRPSNQFQRLFLSEKGTCGKRWQQMAAVLSFRNLSDAKSEIGFFQMGKTLGIVFFAMVAHALGFLLPVGLTVVDLFAMSSLGGVGLTVALFVSNEAFTDKGLQSQAKMGAVFSVSSALLVEDERKIEGWLGELRTDGSCSVSYASPLSWLPATKLNSSVVKMAPLQAVEQKRPMGPQGGAVPNGYGNASKAANGYAGYAPQQGYAALQQSYAAPQQSYAAPQQSYAAPQQSYAPQQQSYAPSGFGADPTYSNGYGAPSHMQN